MKLECSIYYRCSRRRHRRAAFVVAISVTVRRYYPPLNVTRCRVVTTDYIRKLDRTGRTRPPEEKYKTLKRKPFKWFFGGGAVHLPHRKRT